MKKYVNMKNSFIQIQGDLFILKSDLLILMNMIGKGGVFIDIFSNFKNLNLP